MEPSEGGRSRKAREDVRKVQSRSLLLQILTLTIHSTYRMGVGDGLQSLARQEKNEEKQRAIEAEKRLLEAARKVEEEEDRARLKRLEQPTTADDALNTEHHPAEEQTNTNHDDKQIKPKDTKVKIEEVEDEDFVIPEPSAQSTFPTKNEASNESPVGDHGVILGSSFRAQSLSYAGSPAFRAQSLSYAGSPAFQPDFEIQMMITT